MSQQLKIGTVALGRIPRLVAVWAKADPGTQALPVAGVDLWEARVDLWGTNELARVRRQIGSLRATLPVIVTIRGKAEGGQATDSSADRAKRYEALLDLADAVDIEMSERGIVRALKKQCEAQRKTLILSYHDFQRTPNTRTLLARVRAAETMGADVVKLATMLRANDDVVRLAEVQSAHPRPNLATMGMGRIATLSRLLLASLGSVLVYGAFEKAVAPGQANVSELAGLLKLAHFEPATNADGSPNLRKAA
jgi:3-dehydroquinate dehydratase-1